MSFLNKYSGEEVRSYWNAKKNGDVIYAIGTMDNPANGLITKLTATGDIIWEKRYEWNGEDIYFEHIVFCDNTDILITGSHSDLSGNHLIRIDEDGNILWIKYFPPHADASQAATINNTAKIARLSYETYILEITQQYSDGFSHNSFSFESNIYKIAGNGDIVLQKKLELEVGTPYFRTLEISGNKIVLGGEEHINIVNLLSARKGLVVELDANFNVLKKYSIEYFKNDYEWVSVAKIIVNNYGYSLCLFYNATQSLDSNDFRTVFIKPPVTLNESGLYSGKQVNWIVMSACYNNNNFIYLQNQVAERQNTYIIKLNHNFDFIWQKNYDVTGYHLSFLSQVNSNNIIVNDGGAIGSLNLDIESCLTVDDEPLILTDVDLFFNPDIDILVSELLYEQEVHIITPYAITPVKDEVCPPVIDEPCIKDLILCNLYNQVKAIGDNCFVSPELVDGQTQLSPFGTCMSNVINLVNGFNTNNPGYNLIQRNFNGQKKAINKFINQLTIENYTDAWYAYQSMVSILSRLGNCNCENDLNSVTIRDNTSLQSPDFYLQSAGSMGNDSTKGVHLRWTFMGALGENHLPKGNYASTSFNYNRSNDFVKVYRTQYQNYSFTLDFGYVPHAVNPTERFWLYKFNNETRNFFVYFKNAAKYDQVSASIDPFNNPLGFMEAYGNEVIEIENKRELFFAVSLTTLGASQGSSLKVETLSVPENKIFVSKSLSNRIEFPYSSLNSARLICENGRTIRYKPEDCFISKIEFEFYSDFITNTTNNNLWEPLGDFALTLEDSQAIFALEPDEFNSPINGAWLRYNDNAYTKTENYIKKWNGPVESWNRNIKDIVGHYITLSDNEENPRATEYVNINLANEGNEAITIELEPAEGNMEVSNLDMLRMGSYDYHIARMLGLGKLDINPVVFDGEYIYIGEYNTYGNTGDGIAREVHHLSMSLPTSIYTERLPLPVDLKSLTPGFVGPDGPSTMTDENGYSFDGRKRYISVLPKEIYSGEENPAFFANNEKINTSGFTIPIYAGLESRRVGYGEQDLGVWEKPELSHNKKFLNIDSTSTQSFETTAILIPEIGTSMYVHRQTESGIYYYAGYGINWFSRATASPVELSINTDLKPLNSLLPPGNVNALLIREENPLMFTSPSEQNRLSQITDEDKTLIRLAFDYNTDNEIFNYQIPIDSVIPDEDYIEDPQSLFPDQYEMFADEVEIFFRNRTPKLISAQIASIDNDNTNQLLSTIHTQNYYQASTGETLLSQLPEDTTVQNFVGGLFVFGTQQYIIHDISVTGSGLIFTVYKREISNGIISNEVPAINTLNLEGPFMEGDGLFTVVENMQNPVTWGTVANPHSLKVKIGSPLWDVYRELVKVKNSSGTLDRYIEKTRGFWELGKIEKYLENFDFETSSGSIIHKTNTHRGIYKVTYDGLLLTQHQQFNSSGVSVEWFNGSIRVFTESNTVNGQQFGSRRKFNVFKTENIGTNNSLVLYINDLNFMFDANGNPSAENDDIVTGTNLMINYYPSYKVYLYHDATHNLTENYILPAEGEGVHYSIFGLRVTDLNMTDVNGNYYRSKFCVPAIMYAQELVLALVPEKPKGALYATRPDFYGKSTYTFTTNYAHKPHSVSFYRADNQAIISALYEFTTIVEIQQNLKFFGGNDELYFANRWENFIDFGTLRNEVDYKLLPPIGIPGEHYKLPLPDKAIFFQEINRFIAYHNSRFNENILPIQVSEYGTLPLNHIIIQNSPGLYEELRLADFIKEAVMGAFIPLSEIPIIYKYIKENNYKPLNKKQVIRDKNGYLLEPTSDEFDMAPMMKITGAAGYETQFTDFTLDGTSDNVYFYAVKEVSSQMKMGDFSPVLGAIKLVNTNAPEEPKIKSLLPILENRVLGISPKVRAEVLAYPSVQKIQRLNLYRTTSRINAESVMSMDLVNEIAIDDAGIGLDPVWNIEDQFNDDAEVQFGVPLYYRITASRRVEYADKHQNVIVEFAPSKPSKILVTMVVDVNNPSAPVLTYLADSENETELNDVVLYWEKTCYNGKYYLYKMNDLGNWVKIYEVHTNLNNISVQLENTDLESGALTIIDTNGNSVYNHFKMIAENTSGLFSSEEKILTIGPNNSDGIGNMIIEETLIVS